MRPTTSLQPASGEGSAERDAARVLVVEDEQAIADGLVFNLQRKQYAVQHVSDGREALEISTDETFDLILLDVRLPGIDGFEVCSTLRRRGDLTPILMLTARSQPDDVIYGLKAGADDYVTKPFELAELLARVEALLRRRRWQVPATEDSEQGEEEGENLPRLEFGRFWVDFRTWEAQTRDGLVELSRKEVAVMRLFAQRPGEVISRRQLLTEVWDLPHHPNTRVVDNVIVSLRKAFEESAWRPRHIHNVRGVGYRFVP
ncbi:MAG: response regulator transcription factor [Acidobacteriota bacterium]